MRSPTACTPSAQQYYWLSEYGQLSIRSHCATPHPGKQVLRTNNRRPAASACSLQAAVPLHEHQQLARACPFQLDWGPGLVIPWEGLSPWLGAAQLQAGMAVHGHMSHTCDTHRRFYGTQHAGESNMLNMSVVRLYDATQAQTNCRLGQVHDMRGPCARKHTTFQPQTQTQDTSGRQQSASSTHQGKSPARELTIRHGPVWRFEVARSQHVSFMTYI